MVILKLCAVFLTIVILVRFKVPLWGAVLSACLVLALMFQIGPSVLLSHAVSTVLGRSCIELLLITYLLILMQDLMNDRNMLSEAEQDIVGIVPNPKLGSIAFPVISGLLPSPAAVLMAGSTLQKRYENILPGDTMAFVTTYFRHIPEALLPVYTNVILMCAVTGTPEWLFFLLMIPYTCLNVLVPYLVYLKPIVLPPSGSARRKNLGGTLFSIVRNLWPVLLMIVLILGFHISVLRAVCAVIILFLIQCRLPAGKLLLFLKNAWNTNMMLMVATILIFTDLLNLSEAPAAILDVCRGLPVPLFLIYGFIVFAGSIISNLTAMIPAIFPLAASVGAGHTALIIFLASLGHLASQLCPTHICISLCADHFKISINDIFRKTLPVTGIMLAASLCLYFIMNLLPY